MRWNDSRGIMSWDGTTLGESFCPGMERLHEESFYPGMERLQGNQFCPGMERLQGSHSVLGWNDSRGVILSWDGTTTGESFCPGMK